MLEDSTFGGREYTPYEIYMKALYEYFRDDLNGDDESATRSAVELSEFQEDAVKKARRILARYDGVILRLILNSTCLRCKKRSSIASWRTLSSSRHFP